MASGRLPTRDYMQPDSPQRVHDYMSPLRTPASNGDGANGNSAHSNGNGTHATGNGANGAVSRRPGRGASSFGNGIAIAVGSAATMVLPAPAAALAPPRPAPLPVRRKASLAEVFVSFRLRDFRYLTLSTLAAGFAQWAKQIALFALIFDMTHSAVQLGSIAAFRGGVGVVIAPYGGYLADRFPRRVVVVASTFIDAVLAAALAALVLTDLVRPWHVYVIAFGGGLAQSINQPARQAFVYDVTTDETLPNAIAMNSMVQNVSRVLGPSAFGAMIAAWGVGSGLVTLFVLQLVALSVTLLISHQSRQQRLSGEESPWRLMAQGIRYAVSDRRILGLMVLSAIPSLLVYPYIPFLKVVSETVLHKGTAGFGMLSSMMGWGSMLGLFLLAFVGNGIARGRLMIFCFVAYGALLIGFAGSSNYLLSLAILAAAGIPHGVAMALNNTLLQQAARNDMRGRVMSVMQMTQGLQPLGSFPMAFAIRAYGAQLGIGAFIATATVGFIIFALSWTSVRRLK